ncbi:universal stress protein [Pseudonocardia sp. KRD-184]|uniref:Universal stress protein n=1 Tax=Pseudonocardia oceani TaxID=2792013 RepID=A0ABS6UIT5_9PSEU|nr:universal stress protein [Pseudonocardia oceani]MBW0092827.1 universal stress protein [Pseudonocardia oceani]MBW0098629.1 universal stress protein [Pseudonocardia oceani]MBW0111142.1 universal stress protein [Pseudonocardia oceani]MBW0123737.1 universal stress protein [Pseudonocardia oceani]MBW0132151.1 universal stress protein [Pseudonocardia oceani]
MSAYRTIVVGTDGSDTSLAAVDRAAAVAADSAAELVIVCAYTPAGRGDTAGAEDALKDEAYLVVGWTPAEETLRTAEERAAKAGAGNIRTVAADGDPVEVLRTAARDAGADLLVVGNRGLNTLSGRILGSVPSDVARRSGVDVLIVHTT